MLSGPQVDGVDINGSELPLQLDFVRLHVVHSVHNVHSVHLAFRLNRLTPQITD
jgi:hypothetical protein